MVPFIHGWRFKVETFKLFLTQFTDETIAISALSMLLVFSMLVAYWIYNRRKFQQLAHQIPATVVKNYLDSIIQNSTALKSSLFRGGGLEDGIPSVVPVTQLPMGKVGESGISSDVLNQKNAEIAALKTQLGDKDKLILDLEKRVSAGAGSVGDGGEEVANLKAEVERLENLLKEKEAELANAGSTAGESSGGGDEALKQQLDAVTKERDELKDRLQEYEIIEEDLANLKRLQQENEQLKKTIASLKPGEGGAPSAIEATSDTSGESDDAGADSAEAGVEMDAASESSPELEASNSEEEVAVAESESSDDSGDGDDGGQEEQAEQKSAEELLNEFEKMLG